MHPEGTWKEPSGHVRKVSRKRGDVWYAKYRLPDGKQVERKLGPAAPERGGRPPAGYFTRKTAERELARILDEARRGTLPGMRAPGVTFGEVAEAQLVVLRETKGRKPSTLRDYRSVLDAHLLPAFGDLPIEDVTAARIEAWLAQLQRADGPDNPDDDYELKPMSNATKRKVVAVLGKMMGLAERRYGIPNPVKVIDKPEVPKRSELIVFTPAEVQKLSQAAEDPQDAVMIVVAAQTGLRQGELIALRWRSVDFARSYLRVAESHTDGKTSTPKSGVGRSVPMSGAVADLLKGVRERGDFTEPDDLVFISPAGGHVDASALRKRWTTTLGTAGLDYRRWHDLRHTFITQMARSGKVTPFELMTIAGHADLKTTLRYYQHASHANEAAAIEAAFAIEGDEPGQQAA